MCRPRDSEVYERLQQPKQATSHTRYNSIAKQEEMLSTIFPVDFTDGGLFISRLHNRASHFPFALPRSVQTQGWLTCCSRASVVVVVDGAASRAIHVIIDSSSSWAVHVVVDCSASWHWAVVVVVHSAWSCTHQITHVDFSNIEAFYADFGITGIRYSAGLQPCQAVASSLKPQRYMQCFPLAY